MVKVGVIGLGVGEQHIKTYVNCPDVELVGITDYSREVSQKIAEKYSIGTICIDANEVIDMCDLISIASYDDCHFDQVSQCLLKGKKVFVEKPLCQSASELQQLMKLWKKNHTPLMSNLILRSVDVYQWLRNEIVNGKFGEIYAIDMDYLYGRLHKITDGWRGKVLDYSVMSGGGIHMIDLMIWLLREMPYSVMTTGNKLVTAKSNFKYQDYMQSHFHFPSGIIARITANFGCVHRHQHVVRVFGTKGTFIYDDQGPRVQFHRGDEHEFSRLAFDALPRSKGALIPYFIASFTSTRAFTHNARHEFQTMAAVIAANQALLSGKTERIVWGYETVKN